MHTTERDFPRPEGNDPERKCDGPTPSELEQHRRDRAKGMPAWEAAETHLEALAAPPAPRVQRDVCGRDPIRRALEVMVRDRRIASFLRRNDPQALIQALSALGFKTCPGCRIVIDKPRHEVGRLESCLCCEEEHGEINPDMVRG